MVSLKQINIAKIVLGLPRTVINGLGFTKNYIVFMGLLFLYTVKSFWGGMARVPILGRIWKLLHFDILVKTCDRLIGILDRTKKGDLPRIYLIELAFRNMKAKKIRAIITIGGVAVGVGAIVFLVSIGYGLEEMVISRVARLDELKMIDVGAGEVSTIKLDDGLIAKISGRSGVSQVVPVVSMVSKVNFNNSVLDVMTLGVDERYLKAMGIKILAGSQFADKDMSYSFDKGNGKVMGWNQEVVLVKEGDKSEPGLRKLNVLAGNKLVLRQECRQDSEMLGYVLPIEGGYWGEAVWGERYFLEEEDTIVGKNEKTEVEYSGWIRIKAPLWKVDDTGLAVPDLAVEGRQKWEIGCVMDQETVWGDEEMSEYDRLEEMLFEDKSQGSVLGEATASAALVATSSALRVAELFETVVATDSAGIEWVELKRSNEEETKKKLSFDGFPSGEAFISSGMLKMLGMSQESAIGLKFKVAYMVPDSLVPGSNGRLQSEEVEYKVTGVVDDESSSYYYFHLADARRLGVKNYSQLKVIASDKTLVPEVRRFIEELGLRTVSTLDTVAEIEKLFRNVRLLLGLLGLIALAVASLGMFNTMTVSLLERTREVGVMKAMGMLSNEVSELFLAESMIMGVGGGLFGITFGYLLGKGLSLALTSVSILKGQGVINVSVVPWFFVTFIMAVSFVVGIVTGWYPSKRARQISALNALRYE